MTNTANTPSSSEKATSLPAADDPKALRQAVLDHMHVGMTNHTLLAEEGEHFDHCHAELVSVSFSP
jgi:hypothetical protein